MVVFASASAALRCSATMQQGVERENRRSGESVGLRVGLSGGEVTGEDGDYFGDPVVEAARLCALCESGQVLAADVVRAMAGRRNRNQCKPVGPLSLKGLPDPVETVEVEWEPLGGSESFLLPLPSRLLLEPPFGVIGREEEAAAIAQAFDRVTAGNGREVVLVSGEAGQGKTTLAADAARMAYGNGALVLFGHCEEDLSTPYQLIGEALNHYATHAPEDRLIEHVDGYGSELAGLIPALERRLPQLPHSKSTDSDTERYLMFSATLGLFAQMSQENPVILVLDDLQWADTGSLQLLRHLVVSEPTTRLLVLATYRDSELALASPLVEALGALRRLTGVSRMELAGLDEAGVAALLETTVGQSLNDVSSELAGAIYRETDGNPLFVNELLQHLRETGEILLDDSGRWVATDTLIENALPQGVREVIGARVVRLGEVIEGILSVAAIIGRDFDLELLAAASGSSEDSVLDALEAAATVALVRESDDAPGQFSFVHALIQRTLYEDVGSTRRARGHRRVAEALEGLCGEDPGKRVGELARHWFLASQPIDTFKAVRYSRQAADAALASLAPDDALRYYTQAIDLLEGSESPEPVLALDLRIGLGIAQRQSGDANYRETLLEAARQAAVLDDSTRLVESALANSRGFFSIIGAIDHEKVAILELALERLPVGEPERALVLAHLCQELTYGSDIDHRLALAEEALAIAEASDDDETIVRVINRVVLPLRVPILLGKCLTWTEEALTRSERLGDPVLSFWAAAFRTGAVACAGDLGELDHCLQVIQRTAAQINQPIFQWVRTFVLGTRALIAGDLEVADQLIHRALQIATDANEPDADVFFGAQVTSLRWQEGTMDSTISLVDDNASSNPGMPAFASTLACAYAESGNTDEASALLNQFSSAGFTLPLDTTWLTGMVQFAEVAVFCRDQVAASELIKILEPWSNLWSYDDITTEGPVSHYLGGLSALIGDYEAAKSYFAASTSMCARMEARFFAARTDLLWGMLLTEGGNADEVAEANTLLSRASAIASANGYRNITHRAETALNRLS